MRGMEKAEWICAALISCEFLLMENPSERGGINKGIWGPSSANKGIVSWDGCLGFSLPLGAAGEEAD